MMLMSAVLMPAFWSTLSAFFALSTESYAVTTFSQLILVPSSFFVGLLSSRRFGRLVAVARSAGNHCFLPAQCHALLIILRFVSAADSYFFFQNEAALDEDGLLHDWNDGDVSFLPDLWNFLHDLPHRNAFDFDTLLAEKLFHQFFPRMGYGCDLDPAGYHPPRPDRNLFLM